MEINFDDSAMDRIMELYDNMLSTKLGPMMEEQVKRNAPVDEGHLRDSVEHTVDRKEHKLYVSAYGDENREGENRKYYAFYVETGHELVAWGHYTGRVIPPRPFMRPALYRQYPGFF